MSDEAMEDGRSKRPPDTSLHQQRLSAWMPVMNASTAIPHFLIWGLVCLPLGVVIMMLSSSVQSVSVDYTMCSPLGVNSSVGWTSVWSINGTNTTGTYYTCADWVNDWHATSVYDATCVCVINITIPQAIPGPVNLFYGLTNFYQNHRRIWRSRDDVQTYGANLLGTYQFCSLIGTAISSPTPNAPCGALANAMFNDSFALSSLSAAGVTTLVPTVMTGINTVYDSIKYQNPSGANGTLKFPNTDKPPNWPNPIHTYGFTQATKNQTINGTLTEVTDWTKVGYQYPPFISWMHTSALPTFQKIFARVDQTSATYASGLPAGTYQVSITYAYPVTAFGGTKQFVISTSSWLGGSFPLLGYVFIIVGSCYLLIAIAFVITHFRMANSLVTKYGLNNEDLDPDAEF